MSDEDGFPDLSHSRVTIIGLGLMGGSLALALRGKCAILQGLDSDPKTIALAHQLKLADRISSDPGAVLPGTDAVILATPIEAIIHWIGRLPEYISHPCLVLDIGSTKKEIVSAMSDLPGRFDPIGGHPICGREILSLTNAQPDLYQNAPFVLTPLTRTSKSARTFGLDVIKALGARPVILDGETHDRWIASTSHLPYLLACSLALSTPLEAAPLVGPGFHSTSRLAATPDSMMLDVLLTNREEILRALGNFQSRFEELENALRGNPAELRKFMKQAAQNRSDLVRKG